MNCEAKEWRRDCCRNIAIAIIEPLAFLIVQLLISRQPPGFGRWPGRQTARAATADGAPSQIRT